MTHEELEKNVIYLLDRQEIADVIATYSRGVDRLDKDALLSVYHDDAVDDHGFFLGNREAFWEWVQDLHSTYHNATQHILGNQLVEINGEEAHAETYFIFAAMNKAGIPFSLAGGRYVDRLEKRDGRWAITDRSCLTEWAAPSATSDESQQNDTEHGTFQFVKAYQWIAAKATPHQPARDRSDPSYARPFKIPAARQHSFADIKAQYGGA